MTTLNNLLWPARKMASIVGITSVRRFALNLLNEGNNAGNFLLACWNRFHEHDVRAVLSSAEPHHFLDNEDLFSQLQLAYQPRPEYGYDSESCLRRGTDRARTLLSITNLTEPRARVLEASCGDGMTGWCLSSFGCDVHLHDLEDWRDKRARTLPMTLGDLGCRLPLGEGSFDLACCYNAFEHVTDPAASLHELLRLARSGGSIFLDFGPLYASPWGLHAYRMLLMPYPQFLFSEAFLQRKLKELGIRDLGKECANLQPLNRWRLAQFEALWRDSGCEILGCKRFQASPGHTDIVMKYPEAFRGLGLNYDDVTVQSLQVLLRKR
jgi:SAM-dependent methyltransferase